MGKRIVSEYHNEIKALSNPEGLWRELSRMSDADVGRLVKALFELSAIAGEVSKLPSLTVDDLSALEERLEEVVERLRKYVEEEGREPKS